MKLVSDSASMTATHTALQEEIRDFAEREVAPRAFEIDASGSFPRDVYGRVAEKGFLGFTRPAHRGGDTLGWALLMEEFAAASATVADVVLLAEMLAFILDEEGTEEQRGRVGPLAAGETLGAFALTEPNAGSDAAAIETQAVRDGHGFTLDGKKAWINNASVADWAIILASTKPEAGKDGITAFLVDRGGFSSGEPYELMGQRGIAVGELYLEGCKVPQSAMVGGSGKGFEIAMRSLDLGRIGIGALAVGIARAALSSAIEYTTKREQFGKPIASFQGIRWTIADLATDLEAARGLVHRAACLRDAGRSHRREAAMAKLRASDMAMNLTVEALQLHGGSGYVAGCPAERYMRDAKITQIYEGTNQILRQIIARETIG